MPRKKTTRPTIADDDAIDLMSLVSLADADHPGMTEAEFEAFQERAQRRCVDCGGAITYERDGVQCQACADAEDARHAD